MLACVLQEAKPRTSVVSLERSQPWRLSTFSNSRSKIKLRRNRVKNIPQGFTLFLCQTKLFAFMSSVQYHDITHEDNTYMYNNTLHTFTYTYNKTLHIFGSTYTYNNTLHLFTCKFNNSLHTFGSTCKYNNTLHIFTCKLSITTHYISLHINLTKHTTYLWVYIYV